MEAVSKHNNDLVYFSGLLNFAKTEANTIVKGSPIVNTGRGLGRVNYCTLLERNSSILRMFFLFCLGPLIIYDLGGGVVEGFCLSQNKIYLISPPPWLCSILMIPLIGRHPLPLYTTL